MYFKKNKKSLFMLAIALVTILISSFFGSIIQSRGWSIKVSDLRDATNSGEYYSALDGSKVDGVTVKGTVKSGILYMPKNASEDNKRPAIVLTHGYLNNRELQLPNAVELARRGFIVLTVDREGHGNYENENNTGALMATNGLYDSVKYIYNLPQVDKTKIGISGHSMGGYTTAMTLYTDAVMAGMSATDPTKIVENWKKGNNLGLVSAGLMQGWDTFIFADPDVDVGILKARDDEFFFGSKDAEGNPTICREYLQSQGAAGFVGMKWDATTGINVENTAVYVKGEKVETTQGKAVEGAFRVVYEAKEIHPLNHFSTESTGYVVDFFYNAFGTPDGAKFYKSTNQVWVLKEIMATLGWAGIIFMIFPLVNLLLTVPMFQELRKRRLETEDGRVVYEEVDGEAEAGGKHELKGLRRHLSLWIPAVACTLFSGFSISPIQQWAGKVFEKSSLFPQDTTGWVAIWAICCGLFALTVVLLTKRLGIWGVAIGAFLAYIALLIIRVVDVKKYVKIEFNALSYFKNLLGMVVIIGLFYFTDGVIANIIVNILFILL